MGKFINKKPFIIAEISANHNGSFLRASKLIKLAKKSGADAVKLQTYTPDMMTIKKNNFRIRSGLWKNYSLWKLYKEACTPLEWHKKLFSLAKKLKIKIFSTPFNIDGLNFLEKINCPAYKVSSFEMNDLNLIKKIAKTKKSMIISTGLANLEEIKKTYKVAVQSGCKDITLLYCVSNYPSNIDDFSLNNLNILRKTFKCKVGLSDHSKGNEIASLALAYGAEVFEKHIALQNQKKGHDIEFSAKGKEVESYVDKINEISKIISRDYFYRSKSEMKNQIFRRSIYAIKDIKKGDRFSNKNISTFRPNIGLSASYYPYILGKKSPVNIEVNSVLNKNILKKKLK